MSYKILLAEDDPAIKELIIMTLEHKDYFIVNAKDGLEAMNEVKDQYFDIALLDIMLKHYDGYELLHELKKKDTPVIFISAKTELKDRVFGLRLGADDYITKPFEPLELVARIENVLRRVKVKNGKYQIDNITVETKSHIVLKDNREIELTPLEYSILELFILNPNQIFSRDQLLNKVWGYDYVGGTRTVDVHITKLRQKLSLYDIIKTVHKIGYMFVANVKCL